MIGLSQNIRFSFDPLAVFFLAVIALVSVPSFVYSFGYLKGHASRAKIILASVLTLVFILSMGAVVVSANLFLFLVAWEIMSLLSYLLVVFDHEDPRSVEAGLVYLVMTHVGTAFLAAAFLMMYHIAGSFDLVVVKDALATVPAATKHILFLFLLIGFGTKAGVVPLHVWLPYAHPQAPSHISSLMSGAMIKVAVYGFLRIALGLIGVLSVGWGVAVLLLAAATCFVGVMYALLEKDIKKVLAYSSVENMGIILLGVGAAMVFMSYQLNALAAVACAAGLFHLLNHAAFKGLLFLGAGSVHRATDTRDLEKMGGLVKTMPWTAAFFLIGSLAIAGLPPLNGFVGEWLIFQGLFGGAIAPIGTMRIFFVFMMIALAITSGLAAVCFARVFGIGFLGMPRVPREPRAHEASRGMKAGMGMLAAAIVLLGLGASLVWNQLIVVASGVVGGVAMPAGTEGIPVAGSVLNMPMVGGVFFALLALGVLFVRWGAGPARVRTGGTWDCGYYRLTARNEYTATAFSKPLRIAFSFFFLPQRRVEKLRDSYYHVSHFKYEVQTTLVFKKYFYAPLVKGFFAVAQRLRAFQMGSIHWYLGYILIVFMGVIVYILVRY